jgi:hypothetical protein
MSADSLKDAGTRDAIKEQIKNNPQALEMIKKFLNK